MRNTFFTLESFENDIALEVNQDVLQRIHNDGVNSTDMLPVEFYFLTDFETKATDFKNSLIEKFPDYVGIKIQDDNGDFEISGITDPKEMNLQVIDNWNRTMWDFGYNFDCKLDGWQVGT
jgi:hypothetical protein